MFTTLNFSTGFLKLLGAVSLAAVLVAATPALGEHTEVSIVDIEAKLNVEKAQKNLNNASMQSELDIALEAAKKELERRQAILKNVNQVITNDEATTDEIIQAIKDLDKYRPSAALQPSENKENEEREGFFRQMREREGAMKALKEKLRSIEKKDSPTPTGSTAHNVPVELLPTPRPAETPTPNELKQVTNLAKNYGNPTNWAITNAEGFKNAEGDISYWKVIDDMNGNKIWVKTVRIDKDAQEWKYNSKNDAWVGLEQPDNGKTKKMDAQQIGYKYASVPSRLEKRKNSEFLPLPQIVPSKKK